MDTNDLPFVTALCPTFRHPDLLANSLFLWLIQDYPHDRRLLVILDDDPTFNSDTMVNDSDCRSYVRQRRTGGVFPYLSDCAMQRSWALWAMDSRMPTISDKYNFLLDASPMETDIFLTWEDDDIYLPTYVSSHVKALENAEFSKSDVVVTDFPGELIVEGSHGRFHSSLAIRSELIDRIGGWPDTRRADFDQQLMSKLYTEAKGVAKPWPDDTPKEQIPFIYRWHSGAAHCQSTMDLGPDDETWYDRGEQAYKKVPFVGKLEPKQDEFTMERLKEFALHNPTDWSRVIKRFEEYQNSREVKS